jgi:hypothetical protein
MYSGTPLNPFHTISQLDQLGILALRLSQPKENGLDGNLTVIFQHPVALYRSDFGVRSKSL